MIIKNHRDSTAIHLVFTHGDTLENNINLANALLSIQEIHQAYEDATRLGSVLSEYSKTNSTAELCE